MVPDIKLDWALHLVEAGLRITHVQLLAAADSMVAGVEGPLKLPPEHTASLLQLAMNCSRPETAAAAARRLPGALEPEFARKLLVTAATRQHAEVVQGMMQRAAVLQHVDAPTLEPVLCGMIKDGGHAGFVSTLCDLPAAAQFEGD
uniref:Uncharacterized protein n=1 Tax=Tetradesmus obliquus TaxID=3088 RepID=A0A383V733_TETOB|eukprot:jgi/Sobl393_1/12515/SZX60753.1